MRERKRGGGGWVKTKGDEMNVKQGVQRREWMKGHEGWRREGGKKRIMERNKVFWLG